MGCTFTQTGKKNASRLPEPARPALLRRQRVRVDVPGWDVIHSAPNYAPRKEFHLPVSNLRGKNPKIF